MPPPRSDQPPANSWLLTYIGTVVALAVLCGSLAWRFFGMPDLMALGLFCLMGIVGYNLREPDVGTRIGFSFLSIILLASAAVVGPLGSAIVGFVSLAVERKRLAWYQIPFNMGMTSLVGVSGAVAYRVTGGATDLSSLRGVGAIFRHLGLPLLVADIVLAIVNALLLAGVIRIHRGIPVMVFLRRVLNSSGVAYVGYGMIGFLFVVLWFPGQLGPFSAVLIMAPLLAARWAFIQYGDELRAHERTVDTLVTALGTKVPAAPEQARRCAQVAEWVAEELGLRPSQIGTVRHAATLHDLGQLGLPTRLLRRPVEALSAEEHQRIERSAVLGADMVQGIDFLEEAGSAIRHSLERYNGTGEPAGLVGPDIPVTARVLAAAATFEQLTRGTPSSAPLPPDEALRRIAAESRTRFDPEVVEALRAAVHRHPWPLTTEAQVHA